MGPHPGIPGVYSATLKGSQAGTGVPGGPVIIIHPRVSWGDLHTPRNRRRVLTARGHSSLQNRVTANASGNPSTEDAHSMLIGNRSLQSRQASPLALPTHRAAMHLTDLHLSMAIARLLRILNIKARAFCLRSVRSSEVRAAAVLLPGTLPRTVKHWRI